MSRSYQGSRDLAQVITAFEVFFDQWGFHLADVDDLRRLAREQALRDAFGGAYRAVERKDPLEYRAYSRLAVHLDPMARASAPWLRLRARHAVGRRIGRWLQRLWRPLSTSRTTSAEIHPPCTTACGCGSDVSDE